MSKYDVLRVDKVTGEGQERIFNSEMDAFREIYERHHAAVYRFALFLTGEPASAEDLTSETFLKAYTARPGIRQETVRAYLLTITRNLYLDQVRARRRFVELDEHTTDGRPGVDVRVEHESILHTLRTRLQQVARGDRRALLLYAVKEMSYGEIGRVLGVSVNAVKSRISRARESLKAVGGARQNGDRP